MTTDSLTRVGVDMKEYIEQRKVEKRRDGSAENERGRTRRGVGVRKHGGKVQGKQKRRRKQDLWEAGD